MITRGQPRPCFNGDLHGLFAALVVFAAATFNAVLALVNAHLTPVPPIAVMGAEVLIVGAAHLLIIMRFRDVMLPWYALLWFIGLLFIYRTLASGNLDPKAFRDVLILPTFVLLGLTMGWHTLLRLLIAVHVVTLSFMLLEGTATEVFAGIFDIRDYYIRTRNFRPEDFWNSESKLFVSATRPSERILLPFLNLHRTSSIFLEPVSLGNYCVVITAFLCATFRRLSWGVLFFLVAGNLALIIGCDGRLAVISSAVILVASVIAPYVPRFGEVLYMPGILLLAIIAVAAGGWVPGNDDLPSRVAHTVDLLALYGPAEYLGLSVEFLDKAVDSGVAYLITTQSLLGLGLMWVFLVFGSQAQSRAQVRYTHGICIFIASNLLVSFSFLSVKTAALLWVIHGVLQAETASRGAHVLRRGAALTP